MTQVHKVRYLLPLLDVPVDRTINPLVAGIDVGTGVPAFAVIMIKDPDECFELYPVVAIILPPYVLDEVPAINTIWPPAPLLPQPDVT